MRNDKEPSAGNVVIPDPNELVGPLMRGWPLDGVASTWTMDLVEGRFGDLRLRMGRNALVRLFGFDDTKGVKRRRGSPSVRLRIGWEEDDELLELESEEVGFVDDFELEWSELVEANDDGIAEMIRPLVRLPSREPVACTSLRFSDLTDAFGEPTCESVIEYRPEEPLYEWLREGFFVSASIDAGVLVGVGLAAIGLCGEPPLKIAVRDRLSGR